MNEKELKINKRLKVGIITFSILTVIMLIGNKSYAIFQKSVKTDKPIITINTSDEFPPKGPKASGLAKYIMDKAYTNEKELVAIDVSDKSDVKKCSSVEACEGKEIEYRYIGPNVNNYIYLKSNTGANETWRIQQKSDITAETLTEKKAARHNQLVEELSQEPVIAQTLALFSKSKIKRIRQTVDLSESEE